MPYRDGYSVLPNLKPVSGPIFTFDPEIIAQKQDVLLEHQIDSSIYEPINQFIREQTGLNHDKFSELARHVTEDLAIHRNDWLAAAHINFPSGWSPQEKIGKSLREIHEPIPGMNLKNSDKLVRTMIEHGPFMRFVWSIIYKKSLRPTTFNPEKPQIFVKVERQITIGFPKIQAALFVLRQEILENIDYPKLYQSCLQMTPAQKEYKGITEKLLDYLRTCL